MLFGFENSLEFSKINRNSCYGGVAQLGEHLPCKQGVRSSILLISTIIGIAYEKWAYSSAG